MKLRLLLGAAAALVLAAAVFWPHSGSRAQAANAGYSVTVVNKTGGKIWLGSVAEKGSTQLTGLPALDDGAKATIPIPTNDKGQWFGKFVPRQGCTGEDGGSFHCKVGDCGPHADRCDTYTPQPASYAEFHFDTGSTTGQWYDTSYVDGFSVPTTIDPDMANPPSTGECSRAGCPENLLPYCPSDNLVKDKDTGKALYCDNPNPDSGDTEYSKNISAHCPKAYSWSKNDTVPGNDVVRNCTKCNGFTVTFG